MTPDEIRGALEAILFVAGEPVSTDQLTEALGGQSREAVEAELENLRRRFEGDDSGLVLEQTAGGHRFATRPAFDPFLRKFFARQAETRLSMAGLETLAIIAYRQPITAPEINEVRGVNSSGVLRTLLDRRMIRIAGRKPVVGSPFLYRTTKEFLVHFGLNTIQDLPRLEEFSEMLGVNLPEDLILPDEILIENEVALEGGEAATRARAVEHDEDHVDRARAETSDERISKDEPDVDAPADVVSGDVSRGGLAVEDRAPDADEGAVDAGEEDRKPVEFPSNDQD